MKITTVKVGAKNFAAMEVDTVLHTDGLGFWTRRAAAVRCTELELLTYDDGRAYGALFVHFDPATWCRETDGLIYTDRGWLYELMTFLTTLGLAAFDVDYSEQGAQGDGHVDLDVGEVFVESWARMVAEPQVARTARAVITAFRGLQPVEEGQVLHELGLIRDPAAVKRADDK